MYDLIIYGASDDLVEFEGESIAEEFNCYGLWRGRLVAPDGESLIISAEFSKPGSASDWTIGVENDSSPFPDWPMCFTDRPDYEDNPALRIAVPAGTKIIPITTDEEDDD